MPDMSHNQQPRIDERSRHLRRLVLRGLRGGRRGHIGSSLSLVEIIRVLYDEILEFRPDQPEWIHRDRFILSKGHGCLALYAILADKGFFPIDELDRFCRQGALLGGHPDRQKIPGVEASTGALGHGLPIALGIALGIRMKGLKSRTMVLMGDGEINEGSVWEAAMSAAKHKLDNLVAIVDYNNIQSYGPVSEVQPLEPLSDKWRAFGFGTVEVDGHDLEALGQVLGSLPLNPGRPSAVICRTIKGRGISFAENDPAWHHKSRISDADLKAMDRELDRA